MQIGKYKVIRPISEGTFGTVFLGQRIRDKSHVAIKINHHETFNLIKHECDVLQYVGNRNVYCVPKVHYYGVHDGLFAMVIPYYEHSLFEAMKMADRKTRLVYLIQALDALDHIHNCCVLHRDIKPDNIRIRNHKLVIIDFGLSCFSTNNGGILPNKRQENVIGSPMYMSQMVHRGNRPSMRDDFLSMAFVFAEFTMGQLPWEVHGEFELVIDSDDNVRLAAEKQEFCEEVSGSSGRLSIIIGYISKLNYAEYVNTIRLKEFLR